MLYGEEYKVMNEELLRELINEIKKLNEKMDILLSGNSIDGCVNLYDLDDRLFDIYMNG